MQYYEKQGSYQEVPQRGGRKKRARCMALTADTGRDTMPVGQKERSEHIAPSMNTGTDKILEDQGKEQ